jgi:phenylpropionate dioxygenase-like ring-hydroxylating dioxygenase large terminal subunit
METGETRFRYSVEVTLQGDESMEWLTNAWYVAMYAAELLPDKLATQTILNNRLVIFRDHDGNPIALEDRCCHRNAPLSCGRLLPSGRIMCGYHGLEFDGAGRCVHNPHGNGHIPKDALVRKFHAVERHSLIWVWTGEGEPDSTTIPDLGMFDPATTQYELGRPDLIEMAVPWDLVVDNLMDLSHVSYLHDGLLGNSSTIKAETVVSQRDLQVTVSRWMPGVSPPKYFDLLLHGDGRQVDLWHDITWYAPSVLTLDVGASPAGNGRDRGTGSFAAHILTPRTEKSTAYHFMSARNNPLPRSVAEEERLASELAELRREAFAGQDEPMMLSQFENIEWYGGDVQGVFLSVDGGVVRWRRVMAELLKRDRG